MGEKVATAPVERLYTAAYIQHVPMETRAAVAEWNAGSVMVWTGTQQPGRVHSELAAAFQLKADQVRVIVPDAGGGFGGKHTGEVAVEAARLAQAVARPVCLQWSREEEFTWAYFRPAARIEVTAKLDANQRIGNWQFTNYNAGTSALQCPYRTASGQTQFVPTDSPLRQGSYRALASTVNTFARESMMDELALEAQQDPLAFRLKHLDNGRLRDVLVALSDRCQWTDRKQAARQAGRGMGLACGTEKGSFVAAYAEVEVRDGEFRVLSIC
ncbi:MAG: molybdopterin-dependent oxidoreductase, partial [Planctomycetales bacterium]|nr:molybdopterin-dependent oxidoreductase [Planctomycetales bacterium]